MIPPIHGQPARSARPCLRTLENISETDRPLRNGSIQLQPDPEPKLPSTHLGSLNKYGNSLTATMAGLTRTH
jgi:hypothetical protein